MKHLSALWAVLLLAPAAAGQPIRTFEADLFTSSADPALGVRIAPEFSYLGPDRFSLGDRADVERHVWAKAPKGTVEALVIFQFEGLRPGQDGHYQFAVPGGDNVSGGTWRYTPERVRLGGHDYVHNTWVFDLRESAREAPEAESAHLLAMLAERELEAPSAWIMSRYVTEVGEDRRKELILFYLEPLESSGHSLERFSADGPMSEEFARLSDQVVARGEAAFSVIE